MREILHIDMNSFFASCEQAVDPELKKQPLIVGGDPDKRHGIVLAASYDAKAFGVKTTMPIWQAAQLCPTAKIIRPSKNLYGTLSKKVMQIFDEYTPLKEQVSIDEAFLDMTGTEYLYSDIYNVAKEIQCRIYSELDLPNSVGISSNKLLAKMASDYKKPMGITEMYPHQIAEKLWPLPVRDLYGVGKKSCAKLDSMGIKTIGQLANCDSDRLSRAFGVNYATAVKDHANGIDNSPVVKNGDTKTKSISNETTFRKDLIKVDDISKEIMMLSESVGFRLRKNGFKGKTINLKVKFSDFKVITRSKSLTYYTDTTDTIYKNAINLLKECLHNKSIRLVGVGVSNFDSDDNQLSLFDFDNHNMLLKEEDSKNQKVDKVTDMIREKYGYNSIKRGSLL